MTTPMAKVDWIQGFEKIEIPGKSGGTWADDTSPYRGIFHMVEGGWDAAISAYRSKGIPPHFTVDLKARRKAQHVSLNRSSYAMENDVGGVETNRLHAIQIEICGFSADAYKIAETDLDWFGINVVKLLADATGILPKTVVFYDNRSGFTLATETAPQRMSNAEWLAWNGWCGHQHVPENQHWDPGKLDVGRILSAAYPQSPAPAYPINDYPEDAVKSTLVNIPLDGAGNGWKPVDLGFGRPPVGPQVTVNAAYPPNAGYKPLPDVGAQVRDNTIVVVVENGQPGASIDVHVSAG